MKILMVFVDMISGEKLNLCNPKAERTPIDDFLEGFGGTLYANCYTPAPDTPRSCGCMWTGLYPKENGCIYRTRYPGYYMNPEKENIWDILKGMNYNLQIFMRAPTAALGMIPKWADQYIYPDGNNIEGFLEYITLPENTFTLIYLPDFHTYIEMFQAEMRGVKRGERFVRGLLKKIFTRISVEDYDHILLLSDHGFRMSGEEHRHLIEKDRTQTLMLWRKSGEDVLTIDTELRSNLDVFPTVCEMLNYTPRNKVDGKSLSGSGHEYILMEDHKNFNVELGQTIERWAVLWNDHIYWLDVVGWDMYGAPKINFDGERFEKLISQKMTDYQQNKKDYEIIHKYDNDTWKTHTMFSDGTLLSEVRENG